mmetsp:Transcript_55078/g.148475  ORF Transcript_55078/g.148475 Transcript_55078/m.148475 type:complete len:750 (-) Transcript_55078:192-2441(-)
MHLGWRACLLGLGLSSADPARQLEDHYWQTPLTTHPWTWTSTSTVTWTWTSTSTQTHTDSSTSTSTLTETTSTRTTSTATTTTATSTTKTFTTSTSSTSTSTTGPHVFGGAATQEAFAGWLSVWRSMYNVGLWKTGVADPWESVLPNNLKGVWPQVVFSSGGVASGVVTEGMGYGIMMEGFLAAKGDNKALDLGLALTKSWLGMVNGPDGLPHPFAGGANFNFSATKVDAWPYGVSAVEWSHRKLGAAGLPAWKFPIKKDEIDTYMGTATDGDQDALLGMIYLAGALGYPDDFVDMVMRTLISFTSADLGFPDLYRTLPCGRKIFVPKLGSMWGGLTPPGGKYKTKQEPWCYSPGYFAPAHYRTFRDFAKRFWKKEFDDYLPKRLGGSDTGLSDLVEALNSAVVSGYNILYYSSCSSGSVSNWVGVEAPCASNDTLNCPGVPWKFTPWVGAHGGKCAQSGTEFGSYGADASRAAWRIAMDYVLFREESADIIIYDRDGIPDRSASFGAQSYLNRIVVQYKSKSWCDGGVPGDCMKWTTSPFQLAHAFDPKYSPPDVNCSAVPFRQESWWAGFMAYPTFSAFVAPYDEIGAAQMSNWMDTFSRICNFSAVNFTDFKSGGLPEGKICLTSYFEASQAVISTMIMSNKLTKLLGSTRESPVVNLGNEVTMLSQRREQLDQVWPNSFGTVRQVVSGGMAQALGALAGAAALVGFVVKRASARASTSRVLERKSVELALDTRGLLGEDHQTDNA